MVTMNYALEWYGYALEKHDDLIVKFMMHWIAFNWLYSECDSNNEKDKIRQFCGNEETFKRLSRYDAFSTEAIEAFKEGPVSSMRPRGGERSSNRYLYRKILEGSEQERVEALLLSIYHVRCNLFHGSKSLRNDRDLKLVRSSAIIMEGYLEALLRDYPAD